MIHALLRQLGAGRGEAWFWATHAGAELDLLVQRGSRRLGFGIRRTAAPRTTKSIHSAREFLKLDPITVIHAGGDSYPWRRASMRWLSPGSRKN